MKSMIIIATLLASTAAFAQQGGNTQMPNVAGKQLYIQIEPGTTEANGNVRGGLFAPLPNTQGNAAGQQQGGASTSSPSSTGGAQNSPQRGAQPSSPQK